MTTFFAFPSYFTSTLSLLMYIPSSFFIWLENFSINFSVSIWLKHVDNKAMLFPSNFLDFTIISSTLNSALFVFESKFLLSTTFSIDSGIITFLSKPHANVSESLETLSYATAWTSKVVQPSLTANSSLFSGIPKTVLPSFEYTTPS